MFGMFKKKVDSVRAEVKKIENRDLMEAIVGGCLLVAYADGNCEMSELNTISALVSSNRAISHFGTEIQETTSRFRQLLDANVGVGKLHIMRELKDIAANRDDAEEVLVNIIAVATADGDVGEEEMAIIKQIAQNFNLDPTVYGL